MTAKSVTVKYIMERYIRVRGARQHNLKNIDVDIPKNKLVVFTGLSGSGKSSLAFDTIYAEGQRRYVESLSSYARQFLGIMHKPDVDAISGLSPAISIDQKTTSHNPRSTVGTITEIYDYLRLLYARIGHPHCPNCGREIARQSLDQIVNAVISDLQKTLPSGRAVLKIMILAPIVRGRKGEFTALFENLIKKGYSYVRIDGYIFSLSEDITLIKTNKHDIDVVTDRLTYDAKELKNKTLDKKRLTEAVEQALKLSAGLVTVSRILDSSFDFPEKPKKFSDIIYSEKFACPLCNISLPELEPRIFSFNSPQGACPKCTGIGSLLKINPDLIFNPNLTINEGGILPFAKMFFRDTWYSRLIKTVCQQNGINMQLPLGQLSQEKLKLLLYGTGDEIYQVAGENRFGRITSIMETFSGIVAELEKRHSETQSDYMRWEIEKYMRQETCSTCQGKRLKPESLSVVVNGQDIISITDMDIQNAFDWFNQLPNFLSPNEKIIAMPILKEITTRLKFLLSVGLNYLTLSRKASTLSGGEAQRIRLASQIGTGLSGVLYVLDEPSIGLHPRDNFKLITTLKTLRDLDNTVIVVEHDRDIMQAADIIFDFGPQAGEQGGQIIASGTATSLGQNPASITGKFLKESKLIKITKQRQLMPKHEKLILSGCSLNNLKNIDIELPLGQFICVTGVSGSGKSSLIVDTLYEALAEKLYPRHPKTHLKIKTLLGSEHVDKVIMVDQTPIGRTPRSNPATYTGLFQYVRELYAQIPESRQRGFGPGRFSFNVKGGRCEACEGEGQIKIEMQFLADVYIMCEVCKGSRYNLETLDIRYKDLNIAQVLDLSVDAAREFFQNIPLIANRLETLKAVGLGYIKLGQPAPTLSGGEAQRVKLATELTKRQTGHTLYILDEPTTGLHFADLKKLLQVLFRLTELNNTVVVIEHNLDVISNADYIIDLGPEGGDEGGYVVATGTVTEIMNNKKSYTGQALRKALL